MDARGLSGEEVSALVNELGEHEAAAEGRGSGSPQTVVLGSDAMRPMASVPAFNRMSDRIARKLRQVVEPFSRTKPMVTAEPVAVRRFEAWQQEQPDFLSLSIYRFRPLRGGALIAVDATLISSLVDSFYGGTGAPPARRGAEFTGVEERLISRLTDGIIATLTKVWGDIIPAEFQLTIRETNAALAALVEGNESVVIARFRVSTAADTTSTIDILYPAGSLRAIETELSAKAFDENGLADGEWRQRMIAALREVRLDARSVLARPELSWAELLKLQPGDVIPISFPSNVPLLVAGREIALGKIGDQDGRAALKIESMSHGGE